METGKSLFDGFTLAPLFIGKIHESTVCIVCCGRSIVGLSRFAGIVLATRCLMRSRHPGE